MSAHSTGHTKLVFRHMGSSIHCSTPQCCTAEMGTNNFTQNDNGCGNTTVSTVLCTKQLCTADGFATCCYADTAIRSLRPACLPQSQTSRRRKTQYVTASLIAGRQLTEAATQQDKAEAMIQGHFTSWLAWLPASWQVPPSLQVQGR